MTGVRKCDSEVYKKGRSVFLVRGGSSEIIENWVQLIRGDLEPYDIKIDWHYMGGRGIVRYLYVGSGNFEDEDIRQTVMNHILFHYAKLQRRCENYSKEMYPSIYDPRYHYGGFLKHL
jgi:hypothetical protein